MVEAALQVAEVPVVHPDHGGPFRTVAFAGDWHAQPRFARAAIAAVAGRADAVIHVGDFGDELNPAYLEVVSQAAAAAGVVVVFVDGNHDNHTLLAQVRRGVDGSARLADRVWHLPRGFRWEWSGVRFLGLGGAVTTSRELRLARMAAGGRTEWWPGEELTRADVDRAAAGGRVDVMVTHDCPSGARIPGVAAMEAGMPESMLAECRRNQGFVREVVDVVRPAWLWHGHFHTRYECLLEHPNGDTTVVTGLGSDVEGVLDNLHLVDLRTLTAARGDAVMPAGGLVGAH